MAKITKSSLKSIVKECLLEILAEGLGENTSIQLTETKTRKISKKKTRIKNNDFNKSVKNTAKILTDDPVMQAMFADTAETTLQEQFAAGSSGPSVKGDAATQQAAKSDPTDLFAGSGNWAELAFTPNSKK